MHSVLVTGANGQLGNELRVLAETSPHFRFVFTDLPELDICDFQAVNNIMAREAITIVVNCAAYTAVDKAEEQSELASRINGFACQVLGEACKASGASLVHISTDYVFNGCGYRPYVETDPTDPVSAYGRSKLLGEEMILKSGANALIIRTSWLYSSFGKNFVKTILHYGRERGELRVIFDQVGTPTYAADLARAILYILKRSPGFSGTSLYHYSNEGAISWYDFAMAIIELKGVACKVTPIETKDYPLPATRPFYSVFNKSKIKLDYELDIPYWKDSLKECLKLID